MKSNFVGGKFLKFWSFINLPWGQARSNKKFGPDRFSRFDVLFSAINICSVSNVHAKIYNFIYNSRHKVSLLNWNIYKFTRIKL